MAVDPEKYESIRERLKIAIDYAPVDDSKKESVEQILFEHLIGDLDTLIQDSRPPRLYIFGRSGAGKSSLINALAKKEVADVGAVKPETVDSDKYHISFPERHSNWDVVDSRGLFESIPADDEIPGGTIEAITEDIEQYDPDIAVHVMTPDQVRAGKQDFEAITELQKKIPGGLPPIIYCLNKIDSHLSPGDEWPPENNEALTSTITENLDFFAGLVEEETREPFNRSAPVRGYTFYSQSDIEDKNPRQVEDLRNIGVFPTYLKEEPYWNVETMSNLIGDCIPEEAVLQFAQAQRRDSLMKKLARKQTKKAAGVGASIAGMDMTGISDILLLTPLQIYLVMLIGSFSCREFGKDTAKEYFTELGAVSGAGFALRKVGGFFSGKVPGAGQAVNATIAGAGTYAIGRSAEAYYFDEEFIAPEEFITDGKDIIKGMI